MVRYESDCVGCVPDLPCVGPGCQYYGMRPHLYCDHCGESADYILDDETHYCTDCLNNLMNEEWVELDVAEKAELLGHCAHSLNSL